MSLGMFRRGDFDAPSKLAIGVCSLGLLRAEHEVMMLGTGMPLGQAVGFVYALGYGIQDARNAAWGRAHDDPFGPYEYFMFWDDDVVPLEGGAAETLLETMDQNPEIDILGGVYPARQPIPSPIVQTEKNGKPWWGWEDGGIHKVWMTGTGFTIYRVSSIKKINAPTKMFQLDGRSWPVREYFWLQDGTDDHALAIEAEKAGLSWYVHGGVVADQIENTVTGQRFQVKNARQRIGGTNGKGTADESQDSAGSDDSGQAGIRPGEGRGPADIQARRRGGSRAKSGAGASQ